MTQTQSDDLVTRLLPCPFCGSYAVDAGDQRCSKIACSNNDCEADTGPWYDNREGRGYAKAVERWNTRAVPTEAAAEIQRLQAQVAVAREALEEIETAAWPSVDGDNPVDRVRYTARAALASIEGAAG